jgi:hypothetical protein
MGVSLYDERLADLKEIEADLPNTFEHGTGESYVTGPCIPTLGRAGQQLVVGGKLTTIRRTLFIRCELFSVAAPVAKQAIKFRPNTEETAVEYRIADVNKTADGANYELALTGINEL